MATKPPCYKCEERYTACHDKCKEYKEWKESEAAIKKAHKEWKDSLRFKGSQYAKPYDYRHPGGRKCK